MIKKILLALVALIVLVLLVGLFLPSQVTVSRSVIINRPASLVFATVDSFQLFPKWSPWQELDPHMTQHAEGAREGVGAKLVWSGNDKVGTGTQIITAVEANQSVDSDLNFGSMGTAKSVMTLKPQETATRVTWAVTMNMGLNPIAHYIGLMMDRTLGPDFASGLSKLKILVESMPDRDIAGFKAEPVELSGTPVLLVAESTSPTDVAKGYMDGFSQIGKFMAKNKLKQAGAPIGIERGASADKYSFDAGIPVDRADVMSADPVRAEKSYAGKALKTVHTGSYALMDQSLKKLEAYAMAHAYNSSGPPVFSFVDDPGSVPEDRVRTEIYLPIM
jgi:effector-binding domain-containing protein/uncharacterized protein YndB with AHSA1/START domain